MDNFFDQFDQPAQPATPKLARGQLQAGNIDLNNRPVVRNPDGSISIVRSISANSDGQEVLIPTVSDDGRILSDDDAIAQYQRTGRNLGIFDTPDNATAYAQSLHRDQEQQYVPQADGGNFFDQFDGAAAPSTLGDSPLRHTDGRLTEAGWQAERDALAAAQKKEVEDRSFFDNFVTGLGRSLPNLVQGAKQAYIDSVAGLSQGSADVLGDFGGKTLGDARRSAAGYFGDLSKELQNDTNQERRATQDLTGSWGGGIGGFAGDLAYTLPIASVVARCRAARRQGRRAARQHSLGRGAWRRPVRLGPRRYDPWRERLAAERDGSRAQLLQRPRQCEAVRSTG